MQVEQVRRFEVSIASAMPRLPKGLALFAWPALAFALALVSRYAFPAGDQFDHLVLLRRFLDEGYLPRDWYAGAAPDGGVRLPYLLLLAGPARLLGESVTFGLLSVLVGLAMGYTLALLLTRAGVPRVPAVAAAGATMLLPPGPFTVGITQPINVGELIPADVAWLLAFASLASGLKRGHASMLALALAVLATLFNPQIGLLAYGSNALAAAIHERGRFARADAGRLALGGLAALAWPAFLTLTSTDRVEGMAPIQIYQYPRHFLFSAQPVMDFTMAGVTVEIPRIAMVGLNLGVIAVAWVARRRFAAVLYVALLLAVLAAVASALAAEAGRPEFLVTFQGLRLSAVVEPLVLAAAAWIAWSLVPRGAPRGVLERALRPWAAAAAMLVAGPLLLYALLTPSGSLGAEDSALAEQARRTPADSVFAAPVELIWFRVETGRAVVVDWKAMPFSAREAVEWRQRMEALAPGYPGGSVDPQPFLAAAYDAQPPGRLVEAAARYGATHIVTRTQDLGCAGGIEVARTSRYAIYAAPAGGWRPEGCASSPR